MVITMIRSLVRRAGFDVVRLPRPKRGAPGGRLKNRFVKLISEDPLNPGLHLKYAVEASGEGLPYLAYAELRTAKYLGADPEMVRKYENDFRTALPKSICMSHNRYFRLTSLASEIESRSKSTSCSILDVGGGEGQLASFMPAHDYCLAEPNVNGISGSALPFPDRSFDYVVACHVLEHVDLDARASFLDQLISKSRYGLILLNPFRVERTYVEERLRLILDITGARWAEEHLNCTLPALDEIRDYAKERQLPLSIAPNGTLTTSLSFVFTEYFAAKSGLREDWERVNTFFNEKYANILDSAECPNAYLIWLGPSDVGTA